MIGVETKQFGKNPKYRGVYFLEEASAKGLAFLSAKVGDMKLYWLVDPLEEKVVNAKFFSYGGPDSLALGEAISLLAEGSGLNRSFAISGAEVISLLAESDYFPFNKAELMAQADSLISAIRQDYPLALAKLSLATAKNGPINNSGGSELSTEDQKWLSMTKQEQIRLLEETLDREIRGALQVDGGDIEITDIKNGWDVYAEFKGACTSCSASVGSTFVVVESVLRSKLNPQLNLVANSFPW